MTERERILAILNRQEPDQLPWAADLSYWIFSMQKSGVYPAKYRDTELDNGLQKLHRDCGAGFYLQGYHPWKSRGDGWT